ncbi:MAG: HypC/HybG/HupF family hydrogenase formation chaperone [Ignavibacteriae bacterium]|nr:HypC/HybG/HupF family hydrogenase formation chaperone [Ignavibacteriota bacterium]
MCLAVPGKILEIIEGEELLKIAKVSFGGAVKVINISFVPDAKIGDYVIAHVGFALNIIDEEEAQKTMDYLRQIGDIK